MGRATQSRGLAPPAIRRETRAKLARHIVNKVVPALLAGNARARRGAEGSKLIADPEPVGISGNGAGGADGVSGVSDSTVEGRGKGKRMVIGVGVAGHEEKRKKWKKKSKKTRDWESTNEDEEVLSPKSQNRHKSHLSHTTPATDSTVPTAPATPLNVRLFPNDTITAALHLYNHPSASSASIPSPHPRNICIHSHSSPLRPGGGTLSGATSQEEFLCTRTTLLPSLRESFYRLPDRGGIWSPDVLVFRDARPLGEPGGVLGARDRMWVDVVSCAALRFPELEVEVKVIGDGKGEEKEMVQVKRLSAQDREETRARMRALLRIVAGKGVRRLVLGAWGCGAYGNPVVDVAGAWRDVLLGEKRREEWGLEEIVFAISQRGMAREFAEVWGEGLVVEDVPGAGGEDNEEVRDREDPVAEELKAKIEEMRGQVEKVWNPELKSRIRAIMEGLEAQLRERQRQMNSEGGSEERDSGGSSEVDDEVNDEEDEEEEIDGDDYEGATEGDQHTSEENGLRALSDEFEGEENLDVAHEGNIMKRV